MAFSHESEARHQISNPGGPKACTVAHECTAKNMVEPHPPIGCPTDPDGRKQRNDQDHWSATDNSKYEPRDQEPFMNKSQREYFRAKLLSWRNEILSEAKETLQRLQEDNQQHPDLADDANAVTDRAVELRARDRQRKVIAKIDAALQRIKDGTYGYCEETGEPIGLKRLEARPIATLSVEAQEWHERQEKSYRS